MDPGLRRDDTLYMSLHFAAVVPHSPLLHKVIGKKAVGDFDDTLKSLKKVKKELYIAQLDTLFILSPHGPQRAHSFTISGHPELHIDLKSFGDLITEGTFKVDTHVVSNIREAGKKEEVPFMIDGSGECDYAAAIPLLQFKDSMKHTKIIIIRSSQLNARAHIDCGYILKGIAMQSNKRMGVLASADLSHALTTSSPAGFNKSAEKFDKKIQEIIEDANLEDLMNMKQKFVDSAATCSYGPLLMLFGMLNRVKTKTKVLSYEAPHGVGHITTLFKFH
ncbi:MAG: AmmeMemoRadiSam system protein B [Parcubacteria group bacterium]|nr:AmmeMemoRadiSam system protein B [Parcubacteria group bacterium]|tara:strand:- start:135 stop:965 length:831 start_codon:yes stop_codon:yes gene_type:complete